MVLLLEKITDQLTVHPDRTWDQFKLMEQALSGALGTRLAYFEGTIEVLCRDSPMRFSEKLLVI